MFFVSFCAMLVVLVVSERRASACLIMLSAKQGSHMVPFLRLWYGAARDRTHDLPLPKHLRYRDRYLFISYDFTHLFMTLKVYIPRARTDNP